MIKSPIVDKVLKDKVQINFVADFLNFIKKYGVVGLAIGVVVGQAVNSLVNSIVSNIINPILGKILGRVQLSDITFYDVRVGAFLNDLINFLAITLVVYLAIRVFVIYLLTDEEREKFNLPKKTQEKLEQLEDKKDEIIADAKQDMKKKKAKSNKD